MEKLKKSDIKMYVKELNEGFDPYEIRESIMEHHDICEENADKIIVAWAQDMITRFSC